MDALFSGMYEADVKGGCPSIAPEKLLRAMLLQVFYSIRSERQLMEQTRYNLLFRWFIGLSMDDVVWVPTVFSKNRERLIEHDAVIELFNRVLEQADDKGLLSGEHFSVDGTLIQAWAGHKSFVRKDGADDDIDSGNFRDTSRSNDTRASNTDTDARLYCKGDNASRLRYMGHTLTDNRHGLIANAMVTTADGFAEREAAKALINDARQAADNPQAEIMLGADKGYDAQEFIDALQEMNVIPHVAQNTSGRRSAEPDAIAASEGYAISVQKRKLIEQSLQAEFGATGANAGKGLKLRMDHGTQYTAEDFLKQIGFWGIDTSFAFVAEPQANGVAERFNRTLKEQAVHGRLFRNLEEVRQAVTEFRDRYNRHWRLEKLGFMSPLEARQSYAIRKVA